MDDFVIWTVPGSPYARAVMASLIEKGLPWRVRPLAPGGIKTEPHLGFPVGDSSLEGAMPTARVCVGEIARLLGDQPFVAGEALSLADLMLAPQLSFLPEFSEGQALLAPHAKLRDWLTRMEARPSLQATTWDQVAELARAA